MEDLCSVAREFGIRGWTPATSGNYSVRLDAQHWAVTRSGRDKRRLQIDDLMILAASGEPVVDGRPSAEAALHTQLYLADGDIGAVLHVHSPSATVASRLCEADAIRLSGYELLKAFQGTTTHEGTLEVPVLPNDQDIPALAEKVAPLLERSDRGYVYLIRGHGVYAWGADVAAAARHLDAIDFLLTCYLEEQRYRA